jgi:predicted dehydrogenase
MSRQIGVALVGCGYWGMNYARVFSELPGSRLVAACDHRAERREEVQRRFPAAILTDEVGALLALPAVEAVVVATDATDHYETARRCALAGKHLLIEKPLTTSGAEADALVALAEARGLTLMVGHTFLYNGGIRRAREYLDRADLGRIYYLYARRTNVGPVRRDVSAVWDLAAHDVAIFNYLLGELPRWASAVGANVLRNRHADVAFISLGYPGGVIGHIHVSWAEPNKVREVIVVGSAKRLVFDDLNPLEPLRVFEKGVAPEPDTPDSFGEHQLLVRDGDIVSPHIQASEPLKNECGHFLECVAQGSAPLSDGRSGSAVVHVLEAVDRSLLAGGGPVQIGAGSPR